MSNITEFAMAKVVRRIADSNDTSTQLTAKLFAECGVTVYTPDTVKELAWNVCKAFSAWFDARERVGVDNDTDDNKAVLNAYAAKARDAARDWFKVFAVKPGKKMVMTLVPLWAWTTLKPALLATSLATLVKKPVVLMMMPNSQGSLPSI